MLKTWTLRANHTHTHSFSWRPSTHLRTHTHKQTLVHIFAPKVWSRAGYTHAFAGCGAIRVISLRCTESASSGGGGGWCNTRTNAFCTPLSADGKRGLWTLADPGVGKAGTLLTPDTMFEWFTFFVRVFQLFCFVVYFESFIFLFLYFPFLLAFLCFITLKLSKYISLVSISAKSHEVIQIVCMIFKVFWIKYIF